MSSTLCQDGKNNDILWLNEEHSYNVQSLNSICAAKAEQAKIC